MYKRAEKHQHMIKSIDHLHEGNTRNLFMKFKALNTKICIIPALVNEETNSAARSGSDKAYLLTKTFADSFLPDQLGRVVLNGIHSDRMKFNIGVPQGSPVLFLLYMNDLTTYSMWYRYNKVWMEFPLGPINGRCCLHRTRRKYLGLFLDSHMTCSKHVNYVYTYVHIKVSGQVYPHIIYYTRQSVRVLSMHLHWNGAADIHKKKLERIQRVAMCRILGVMNQTAYDAVNTKDKSKLYLMDWQTIDIIPGCIHAAEAGVLIVEPIQIAMMPQSNKSPFAFFFSKRTQYSNKNKQKKEKINKTYQHSHNQQQVKKKNFNLIEILRFNSLLLTNQSKLKQKIKFRHLLLKKHFCHDKKKFYFFVFVSVFATILLTLLISKINFELLSDTTRCCRSIVLCFPSKYNFFSKVYLDDEGLFFFLDSDPSMPKRLELEYSINGGSEIEAMRLALKYVGDHYRFHCGRVIVINAIFNKWDSDIYKLSIMDCQKILKSFNENNVPGSIGLKVILGFLIMIKWILLQIMLAGIATRFDLTTQISCIPG
ncbi:hypothetical protein RFI_01881 [Reticulomyxa filosa]|uniref:Uncharacterized protein n=1 Tax=Reticulomyxa filosa TaxID=46433 RepID=X6PAN5_RETFI|nr:hypothetical protein RFI_01881 [Reticulomyxa filosa]|eukprot:ETO35193.1 hypothetical protein RFI_01881 [Reticulomyxa filosa]